MGGGKRDRSGVDTFHRAIHHVNLAHGAAVDILRARVPGALIGCIQCAAGAAIVAADVQAAEMCDVYWNKVYPDPQCLGEYPAAMQAAIAPFMQAGDLARIKRPLDWFGLITTARCSSRPTPMHGSASPSATGRRARR